MTTTEKKPGDTPEPLPHLPEHMSPVGWEHINLTGDYIWRSSSNVGAGKFRPLRRFQGLQRHST